MCPPFSFINDFCFKCVRFLIHGPMCMNGSRAEGMMSESNLVVELFIVFLIFIDSFQITKKIRSKLRVNEEDPLIRVSEEAKGIRFA